MPHGKEAFTNRDGNYIQPTIIDIDKEYGLKEGRGNYKKMSKSELESLRKEINKEKEERIDYILSVNPFYVAQEYSHLILREDGKLKWDEKRLREVCEDDVVRYNLSILLRKRSEITNLLN